MARRGSRIMTNLAKKPPLGQKTGRPKNGTAAGKAHMALVKQLPCVICGASAVEVHHCRSNGTLRDDMKTIPLCFSDHRGPSGYHLNKAAWEAKYGPDTGFIAVTRHLVATMEDDHGL